jgi:uncharacterized membrane protein YuzA (DUF378 family)
MFTQANLKLVATILVIAGALNWLSIGTQNPNFVGQLAGSNANYVYIAVGAAGVYLAYLLFTGYRKSGKLEAYDDDEGIYESFEDEEGVYESFEDEEEMY